MGSLANKTLNSLFQVNFDLIFSEFHIFNCYFGRWQVGVKIAQLLSQIVDSFLYIGLLVIKF